MVATARSRSRYKNGFHGAEPSRSSCRPNAGSNAGLSALQCPPRRLTIVGMNEVEVGRLGVDPHRCEQDKCDCFVLDGEATRHVFGHPVGDPGLGGTPREFAMTFTRDRRLVDEQCGRSDRNIGLPDDEERNMTGRRSRKGGREGRTNRSESMTKHGVDVGRFGTGTDERFTDLVHGVLDAHADSTFVAGKRP